MNPRSPQFSLLGLLQRPIYVIELLVHGAAAMDIRRSLPHLSHFASPRREN